MKRVLVVGFDPATVDFSDPALPPGVTAEKIHAGINIALADMAKRGWRQSFASSIPTRPRPPRWSADWAMDATTAS